MIMFFCQKMKISVSETQQGLLLIRTSRVIKSFAIVSNKCCGEDRFRIGPLDVGQLTGWPQRQTSIITAMSDEPSIALKRVQYIPIS